MIITEEAFAKRDRISDQVTPIRSAKEVVLATVSCCCSSTSTRVPESISHGAWVLFDGPAGGRFHRYLAALLTEPNLEFISINAHNRR